MILSIIVPVYQAKNTLCRCADSILSKRDIEFELILVNDGSTDGSQELWHLGGKREIPLVCR